VNWKTNSYRELLKSENKNAASLRKWFLGSLQNRDLENGFLHRITKIRKQKRYSLRKVL